MSKISARRKPINLEELGKILNWTAEDRVRVEAFLGIHWVRNQEFNPLVKTLPLAEHQGRVLSDCLFLGIKKYIELAAGEFGVDRYVNLIGQYAANRGKA